MSTLGAFDTEDNLACTVSFPNGTAHAHLTWTAGVRKVIYTLHGERGALRVEDDDIELTLLRPGAAPERAVTRAASDWMDASHAVWFRSL